MSIRQFKNPSASKSANCCKVIFFQPNRHFRVSILIARQFNDRNDSICVPIERAALAIDSDDMRNRSIGSFANVALMMELIPELAPNMIQVLVALEPPKQGPRIERNPVSTLQFGPPRIVKAQHLSKKLPWRTIKLHLQCTKAIPATSPPLQRILAYWFAGWVCRVCRPGASSTGCSERCASATIPR